MRLRCKKAICYHWGTQFVEGKDYLVLDELVNINVCLITDYYRYFSDSKIIASSGQYLHLRQENFEKILPGYNQAIQNRKSKKYQKEISIPCFEIQNEQGEYLIFSSLTHGEISEIYGVELINGKVSLDRSIDMVDEYFDITQYNRENKLDSLGIK